VALDNLAVLAHIQRDYYVKRFSLTIQLEGDLCSPWWGAGLSTGSAERRFDFFAGSTDDDGLCLHRLRANRHDRRRREVLNGLSCAA
jgi:hypothetical protein